jgi:hypothetical protein
MRLSKSAGLALLLVASVTAQAGHITWVSTSLYVYSPVGNSSPTIPDSSSYWAGGLLTSLTMGTTIVGKHGVAGSISIADSCAVESRITVKWTPDYLGDPAPTSLTSYWNIQQIKALQLAGLFNQATSTSYFTGIEPFYYAGFGWSGTTTGTGAGAIFPAQETDTADVADANVTFSMVGSDLIGVASRYIGFGLVGGGTMVSPETGGFATYMYEGWTLHKLGDMVVGT